MDSIEALTRRCYDLESEVYEYRQQLDLVLKNVPDIIYLLDKQGDIVFISDSIQKYGYSPQELRGTSILQIIHPEDRLRAVYRINERRKGDRKTTDFQVRFITQDQKLISMEIRDEHVEDPPIFLVTAEGYYSVENRQAFQGTVGVARDITLNLNRLSSSPPSSRISEKGKKLIAICANCKSIRDKDNFWILPEVFFTKEYGIAFTHSICPECSRALYPHLNFDKLR